MQSIPRTELHLLLPGCESGSSLQRCHWGGAGSSAWQSNTWPTQQPAPASGFASQTADSELPNSASERLWLEETEHLDAPSASASHTGPPGAATAVIIFSIIQRAAKEAINHFYINTFQRAARGE